MRTETLRALLTIDRRFYDRHAHGFAGSRRLPWEGWQRALEPVFASIGSRPERRLRVLDAGCAHARLAAHLANRTEIPVHYVGIDRNLSLLARAPRSQDAPTQVSRTRQSRARAPIVVAGELTGDLPFAAPTDRRRGFDLIALFGVLHHIPGHVHRRSLMVRLANLLAPDGHLVATAWRVERQPRFEAKVVPWHDHNQRTGDGIDTDDLEPGDHLLVWGADRETPRFCHAVDDAEADRLAAATGLDVVDRFESDGPDADRNLYLVLRATR